jgi:hypothetical protein
MHQTKLGRYGRFGLMLLKNSVGNKGINHITDVKLVQEALNRTFKVPLRLLDVDGIAGSKTKIAIANFQQKIVGLKNPDSLIEPKGKTWDTLKRYLNEVPSVQLANYRLFPVTGNAGQSPQKQVTSKKIAWGNKVSASFKLKVIEICNDLELSPDYLMSCMAFETGETFSATIKNAAGSGAVGLIQFMPSTAKALGTSIEKLEKLSAVEQLQYVKSYFLPQKGKLSTLEDVYMAILYPAAVGKPVTHVLFEEGKKTYEQNKGFDSNKDGKITLQEISAKVRQKYDRGLSQGYLG